jgi:hypothetical protein
MTVAVWPSELPNPERGTYQAQREDTRLKKRGRGAVGYRRMSSSTPRLISMSIEVPRSLKAVFDNFHMDTTADGTLPFWMPDATTDGWPMLSSSGQPVLMPDGTPILLSRRMLCLFGDEMPSESVRGVRFEISFNLLELR